MAGRYATALFDLATEEKSVDKVGDALTRFEALVAGSEDLQRLVRSPVFSSEEQSKAVSAVLAKAGIDGLAGNFIRVAAANRRLFAVPDMTKAFRAMVARSRGEANAEVVSARPLAAEQIEALKTALKASVGKDIRVDLKVDPALIGGLTVKIGSRMIDASLKTKLNSIKHAMKEVG